MGSQIIKTAAAPQPAAPISQAVRSGNFVFVSGITPFDLNLKLVKDDFEAQMRQTMSNLGAILKASESGFDRVLKCTVIVARRGDWRLMNNIYGEYWKDARFPARSVCVPTTQPDHNCDEVRPERRVN